MKKALIILFVLFNFTTAAQSFLSKGAEISVITCGPYQGELYSAFGHSAIRVYDPVSGLDVAYNYGIFHFDSNFYFNFTRGHLLYNLGVYPYPQFRNYYISQNRYVHEQILDLNPEQKQEVLDYLQMNARPKNAIYRYDYFYNNCATKVRDVFVELFHDDVKFDGSYVTTSYTIRDLTEIYLAEQPWGDLGIDICLGLPMDKKLTPFEYMFLPDYVESGFDHATIKGRPIVKRKVSAYEPREEIASGSLFHPGIIFGLFLGISVVFTIYDLKREKLTKWFDVSLFFVIGLTGTLLLLLWTATDHHAAAKNLNLFWAFPFHLIASILLIKNRNHFFLTKYFAATTALSAGTLILWPYLPQHLNIFLVPYRHCVGTTCFYDLSVIEREIMT